MSIVERERLNRKLEEKEICNLHNSNEFAWNIIDGMVLTLSVRIAKYTSYIDTKIEKESDNLLVVNRLYNHKSCNA